jgi:hypothetical protein
MVDKHTAQARALHSLATMSDGKKEDHLRIQCRRPIVVSMGIPELPYLSAFVLHRAHAANSRAPERLARMSLEHDVRIEQSDIAIIIHTHAARDQRAQWRSPATRRTCGRPRCARGARANLSSRKDRIATPQRSLRQR